VGDPQGGLVQETMSLMKVVADFDPDATAAMSEAYDRACKSMHDWGQPVIIREIIAKRIIQLASMGERDPDQLCDQALKSLGFSESPGLQPGDRRSD
jgi:hypothetical protein